MKRAYIVTGLLAAGALVGCAGGGNSSLPAPGSSMQSNALAHAQMIITIPAKTSSASPKRPAYVSPSTQSLTVAIDGGTPVMQNLTPGSTNCNTPAPLSPLTCTVPIAATAGVSHTFTFITYDATNAGGNKLSLNTVTQALNANVANTIPVVLQGIPAALTVTQLPSPNGLFGGTPASGFTMTDGFAVPINIVALDADGSSIVGPGAPTITVAALTQIPTANFTVAAATNGNPDEFTITSATFGSTATLSITATPAGSSGAAPLTTTAPLASAPYVSTAMTTDQLGITNTLLGIGSANGTLNLLIDNVSSGGVYSVNPATPGTPPVAIATGPNPSLLFRAAALAYNPSDTHTYIVNSSLCIVGYGSGATSSVTIAGSTCTNDADNPTGTSAAFNNPNGIVSDAAGNLYVTEGSGCTLRKVTTAGAVTTVAGLAQTCALADNPVGTSARFVSPIAIAYNSANGKLYVADNCAVRSVDPANGFAVVTVAGTTSCTDADSTPGPATFGPLKAIAYDVADGNLYVTTSSCSLRRITTNGTVTTPFHSVGCRAADGFGLGGSVSSDSLIAYNPGDQNLYILDLSYATLREVLP